MGYREVVGRRDEDDAVDDGEHDDPGQGRAVDKEAPGHGWVEEEDDGAEVDFPDRRVGVPPCIDAQGADVGHLGLGAAALRDGVAEVLVALAGGIVFVRKVHVAGSRRVLLVQDRFLRVGGRGFSRDDDDGVAAVGCLRHEEDDGEHEDAEEDGANAEGPAVAVVLDDVAGNEGAAGDAGQEEEVPDGDASGAFVDEVEV